ncbi:MAG: right-handed parallel beta-helix repeat-containing protein [Candidatus Neomarinimicrobiota bacterium]
MKLAVLIGSVVGVLLCLACEQPFNTKVNSDGDLLKLEISYDGRRIIDTLQVGLSWLELTVEYFQSYTIERKNIDAGDTVWTLRATLADPFAVAYTDVIDDDATFHYRLRLNDQNDDFRASEAQITINSTTRLTVPTERSSIAATVSSQLIDNGDTVAVLAGYYSTGPIHFEWKNISLIGIAGADDTFLDAHAYNDSGGPPRPLITMASGVLEGFTILGGRTQYGGAVYAIGSALIRQCTIANNEAVLAPYGGRGGFGGAIFLGDSARVENCLIRNNCAEEGGGGIYVNGLYPADSRIVNCTIYDNYPSGIVIEAGPGVTVSNSIVWRNRPQGDIISSHNPRIEYTNFNSSASIVDSTNLNYAPAFVDIQLGDFHLRDESECIDAGNPAQAYNDPDGSTNDLGCFGGPGGNWLAPLDGFEIKEGCQDPVVGG